MKTLLLSVPILFGSLHANTSDRVEKLEKEMAEITTINSMDNFGVTFSSASPKGSKGIYAFIDPLYWHTKVGGSEYAISIETVDGFRFQFLFPPYNGKVKGNSFGWDLGLRFGLGYHFDHDSWDINANFTTFTSNQTSQMTKYEPSYVRAPQLNTVMMFRNAKSHYNVGYNNLNLEIARSYYASKRLSLSPHFGVNSAWIDLDQNVHYTLDLSGPTPLDGTIWKLNTKSFAWGLGPRAGLNTEIYLGDGFSLTSNLSASLLYSYVRGNIHFKPDANSLRNQQGGIIERKMKSKNHLFTPSMQMFLGLIWQTYIMEDTKHLTLGAGYEVNYYWRMNQMLEMDETRNSTLNQVTLVTDGYENNSEDVMFYGITFKIKLEF